MKPELSVQFRPRALVSTVSLGLQFIWCSANSAPGQLVSGDWNYVVNNPDRNNPNGSIVITKYVGPGGAATIPAAIDGKPVLVVGAGGASYIDSPGAKLTTVIIPDSVRVISDRAFWEATNLAQINFGTNVQSIGFAAFAYASRLTNVVLPNSLRTLNGYAFYMATNLTNATLGTGLTNIGMAEFSNCGKLRQMVIPAGVTSIGDFAFNFCTSLTNVVLPAGLTNIGRIAFQRCEQLRSIVIPNSVRQIGQEAFSLCFEMTNVVFGTGLTNLGRAAFQFCDNLTSVTVRGSLTNIPESLFDMGGADSNRPPKLASVVLPATIASVGDYAFADAPNLTTVLFMGAQPSLAGTNRDVYGTNRGVVTYFLAGATGWGATFAGQPTGLFSPRIASMQASGGSFGFSWTGPNRTPWPPEVPVGVQYRSSFSSGSWNRVASAVTNDTFSDPGPSGESGFYRVIYP